LSCLILLNLNIIIYYGFSLDPWVIAVASCLKGLVCEMTYYVSSGD